MLCSSEPFRIRRGALTRPCGPLRVTFCRSWSVSRRKGAFTDTLYGPGRCLPPHGTITSRAGGIWYPLSCCPAWRKTVDVDGQDGRAGLQRDIGGATLEGAAFASRRARPSGNTISVLPSRKFLAQRCTRISGPPVQVIHRPDRCPHHGVLRTRGVNDAVALRIIEIRKNIDQGRVIGNDDTPRPIQGRALCTS